MASNRRFPAGTIIAVLVLVFVAVGFWREWWSFNMTDNEATDETEMTVTVDKQRLGEDAQVVKEKTRTATESMEVAADVESIRGEITAVADDGERITIETEGGNPESFALTSATEIVAEDESPGALDVGDPVVVTYRDNDNTRTVLKVAVVEEEATAE